MTQNTEDTTTATTRRTDTGIMSKLALLARPFIRAGRHLTLTIGLMLASFVLYIITTGALHALTGDPMTGLVVPWGIATVIAYRVCRHHVF